MKEIWKQGKISNTVISNRKVEKECITGHSDIEYYGGVLICESVISTECVDLIVSAPAMKGMLKMFINAIEGTTPDEQGCYTQRFGKAMLDEAKRIIGDND